MNLDHEAALSTTEAKEKLRNLRQIMPGYPDVRRVKNELMETR